jgi:hypothetical protein
MGEKMDSEKNQTGYEIKQSEIDEGMYILCEAFEDCNLELGSVLSACFIFSIGLALRNAPYKEKAAANVFLLINTLRPMVERNHRLDSKKVEELIKAFS